MRDSDRSELIHEGHERGAAEFGKAVKDGPAVVQSPEWHSLHTR